MKALVKIVKEVEIEKIIIDINIRYVGDSDDDDDVPTDFPLLRGNQWNATVMIDSGQILEWPKGNEYEVYCKVCDAGIYTLIDDSGSVVSIKDGYVPNGIVPGEYGDYVHLVINSDGVITNWPKYPSVDEFFCDDE